VLTDFQSFTIVLACTCNKTVVKKLLVSYGYRAAVPGGGGKRETNIAEWKILYVQTVMKNVPVQ